MKRGRRERAQPKKRRRRKKNEAKPQEVFSSPGWTNRASLSAGGASPLRVTGRLPNKHRDKTPSGRGWGPRRAGGAGGRQMPDSGPGRWALMNPEKQELKPGEVGQAAGCNYRCAFGFFVHPSGGWGERQLRQMARVRRERVRGGRGGLPEGFLFISRIRVQASRFLKNHVRFGLKQEKKPEEEQN